MIQLCTYNNEGSHCDTLELRACLVKWDQNAGEHRERKQNPPEMLGCGEARRITWNMLAVKKAFHSSKKTKQKHRKQNKPSHRSSKSHLIYPSVLLSTFAEEFCFLNSGPTLHTLSKTFSKALANVSQILVQGVMSGWLPQSLLRSSGKMEIPGSCPRNPHSIGLS